MKVNLQLMFALGWNFFLQCRNMFWELKLWLAWFPSFWKSCFKILQKSFWSTWNLGDWGGIVCSVNWQVVYAEDPAFKIRLFFFPPVTTFSSQYYLRPSVLGHNWSPYSFSFLEQLKQLSEEEQNRAWKDWCFALSTSHLQLRNFLSQKRLHWILFLDGCIPSELIQSPFEPVWIFS